MLSIDDAKTEKWLLFIATLFHIWAYCESIIIYYNIYCNVLAREFPPAVEIHFQTNYHRLSFGDQVRMHTVRQYMIDIIAYTMM